MTQTTVVNIVCRAFNTYLYCIFYYMHTYLLISSKQLKLFSVVADIKDTKNTSFRNVCQNTDIILQVAGCALSNWYVLIILFHPRNITKRVYVRKMLKANVPVVFLLKEFITGTYLYCQIRSKRQGAINISIIRAITAKNN